MAPPFNLCASVLATLPALQGTDWQPLSGGRTNRLWRVGTTVVKVYDRSATSPLFPNDPLSEAKALAHFGTFTLSPVLEHAGDGWIAYRYVEGAPWRSNPARVAALIYQLHSSSPITGFRALPSGSAAIVGQARAILAGCTGQIGSQPADPGIPPVRGPYMLHGDAVPGNIIDSPDRLTLIDWQCPASGDPTEDIATFLSPAMQWLYRGRVLSDDEASAFLAAYPDPACVARFRALAPLYRWRMAAHCLWKAERGATDYAKAIRIELG